MSQLPALMQAVGETLSSRAMRTDALNALVLVPIIQRKQLAKYAREPDVVERYQEFPEWGASGCPVRSDSDH